MLAAKTLSFLEKVNQYPKTTFVFHSKIEERLLMHSHNKHQLTYVEGGAVYLKTKDNSYFLPARHFVWIPAGMEHFIELKTSISMIRNIYIPPPILNSNTFFSKMGIYPAPNLILEMILFTENWSGNIFEKEKNKYQYIRTLGNVIGDMSKNPLPVVLPTTTNERLSPILAHIHQNLNQPLLLKNTAILFGFSSRSLSRLFRTDLDISFLQYVKLTRIIRSMEKLLQTEMSISEIAYASGYNSPATFSNTFYNLVKTRPVDFRKANREISG
ncbi:helix-turn-helix domain-containing protein [Flavobacterium granuli]|uniref:AraC family transcriptional regulator n=1 Tax=Flavobacterium granuli TaxID=280093 RepID=A0A1M5I6L3_9FLAO|nr:AraC family transcriptional regulator [Flavobacterium granuli]PRZ27813.1 AraC family transcriptional regulator [Flavobacterium granuli]SHG23842.1 transcriptional regulator, AraC family [Flavobacterium granuli]